MQDPSSQGVPPGGYPPYSRPGAPASRPEPRSPLPWLLWVLLLLLAMLAAPYVAENLSHAIARGRQRAEAEVAREELAKLPDATGRFRWVAKAIEPSVVAIETTQVMRRRVSDEWSHLFGRQPEMRAQGQGSGVIIDADEGYILTNFHVVNQATRVDVRLADGSVVPKAQVVGRDPLTDIAVIKINHRNLTAAKWGNSDELEVGDPVLAVGSPFGLAQSVTAGIISAKGRRGLPVNLTYQDFLQTDAAINPGNSGGPLVNMKGEVVGINTAIIGPSYQGVGFAIPSQLAQEVYQKIKAGGTVARGWLGVELQPLTDRLAKQLGLENTRGALVASVLQDGPAHQAGIEPGDVIVRWNQTEIKEPTDLSMAVARTAIGSKATVVFLRDGQQQTATVTVGERPPQLEE